MVLEYSLGTALAAKACTQYMDGTLNGTLSTTFENLLGKMDISGLDKFLDVPSFIVVIIFGLLLSAPVKALCTLTNILVIINLLVISGIVLIGIFNMDPENWTSGDGFFPNGASGVFSGAAICYFGFVGYDLLSINCKDVAHRSRILPTAVSMVFLVGLLATFTISAAITLFIPYSLLQSRGSLLEAFSLRGVLGMQYFSTLGSTAGLVSAGIASAFAQVKLLQSLSSDGLLFGFLKRQNFSRANINTSIVTSCVLSSIFTFFCDIRLLVRIVGVGTTSASIAVAVSVLCLRYGVSDTLPLEPVDISRDSTVEEFDKGKETPSSYQQSMPLRHTNTMAGYGSVGSRRSLSVDYVNDSFVTCLSELSPHWGKRTPDQRSSATSAVLVSATMLVMLLMGIVTLHVPRLIAGSRLWVELTACGMFMIVIFGVVMICRQPRHRPTFHNRVSCVPVLPLCAILLDVHLLVGLASTAWIVFLVWLFVGSLIYAAYGMSHSIARLQENHHSEVNLANFQEGELSESQDRDALVESF